MIENCYKEIVNAIKYRNKYPIGSISTMESIVTDAFEWVDKRIRIPNVKCEVSYLTEDKTDTTEIKLYLIVLKNTLTKEYVVGTIKYIFNKKESTQRYKFEVLDYKGV